MDFDISKMLLVSAILVFLCSSAAAFAGGDGSSSDPYEISNCTELQDMQNDLDAHYELVDDVNCSNTSSWNGGSGFNPIGSSGSRFYGSLNGQNHIVDQLYINRGHDHVGLIGYTQYCEVKNIGLTNVDITGKGDTGGALGVNNRGTISNIYTTGNVVGEHRVGGLVGTIYGSGVYSSFSTGSVSGDSSVGGLVGQNSGSVSDSYAVGSLVGYNDGGSVDGSALSTSEMQGSAAESNMSSLDFTSKWTTVLSSDSDATSDGYPILQGSDRQSQLEAQGIYTVPDSSSPVFSGVYDDSGGSVFVGAVVNVSVYWEDSVSNLSEGFFKHNGSGSWSVSDSVSFNGTNESWYNVSINTSDLGGRTLCWVQEVNDTVGNMDSSMDVSENCFDVREYGSTISILGEEPVGGSVVDSDTEISVEVFDSQASTLDVWFFDGSGGFLGSDLGVVNGSRASWFWDGLEGNSSYSWFVNVSNGKGNYTSEVFGFETGLGVELSFEDVSDRESGFNVYSNASGSWERVHSFESQNVGGTGRRSVSFIDETLSEEKYACYSVAAFNGAGESGRSQEACLSP
ncbi:MAG: hypothetical protein MUP58_00320 [Candidatus Nanohaloarchaeota archaeon QJJ-9]|nr:hypothetical protein [Candidatus Nanohaloarchaeota archaeon QJJ-9]